MGKDTVPSQYFLCDGTVPSRYFLRDGTVPSRYFLRDGTVPSPNHYQKINYFPQRGDGWGGYPLCGKFREIINLIFEPFPNKTRKKLINEDAQKLRLNLEITTTTKVKQKRRKI